jgi:ABC-type nitrate/sulfonate/bicarbonate transport system substrate-binding protein
MKKKSVIKKILVGALAGAMIFSLAACGSSSSKKKSSSSDSNLKQITVCLDWTPNTNHTGLYTAIEKGYFKKQGLKVKVVQPSDDGAEQIVGSGKAQFGVSAQDTMANALVGKSKVPITCVAAILQHNTSGIISRKADGITSPKGMMNHKYATWDQPIEKAVLKEVVNNDGGDFSKVKLIPSTVTDEASALKKKSVDCIWVFNGWATIACKQAGLKVNFWYFKDLNKTFDYYTPVYIANNNYLKKHPKQAKAFMKALSEGYNYAAKHPKESADILMKENKELRSNKKLIYASQKYLSKQYISDAKQWGYVDPARWNRFYSWLDQNNLVKEKLTRNEGFTNDYLPAK